MYKITTTLNDNTHWSSFNSFNYGSSKDCDFARQACLDESPNLSPQKVNFQYERTCFFFIIGNVFGLALVVVVVATKPL